MIKYLFSAWLLFSAHLSFSQNKDIEQLQNLNREWIASYPKKDSATLSRIFADDFILVSPGGIQMTGKDILRNLSNQTILSSTVDSASVRLVTSDVAIITGYASFVLKAGDKEMTGRTCYQDVYRKQKGQWKAVAAHVTSLATQ